MSKVIKVQDQYIYNSPSARSLFAVLFFSTLPTHPVLPIFILPPLSLLPLFRSASSSPSQPFTSFHSPRGGLAYSASGDSIDHIDQVTLRRARLVPRWVTVRGYTVSVCNQPCIGQLSLRPSAGRETSTGQGRVAVLCGREDNRRSGVALAVCHRLCRAYPDCTDCTDSTA